MKRASLGTCLVTGDYAGGTGLCGSTGRSWTATSESRRGGELTIDGSARAARFAREAERATARASPPSRFGYEAKVKGVRQADGSVLAQEIEAKPNGVGLFENDLRESFDALEASFRSSGRMFEEGEYGDQRTIGALWEEGPEVDRARSVFESLVPSHIDNRAFRVYVVQNPEWNAIAAPNGAIYVFSGLLDALDDDELAMVLGHELAHVTLRALPEQYKEEDVREAWARWPRS